MEKIEKEYHNKICYDFMMMVASSGLMLFSFNLNILIDGFDTQQMWLGY